jgi:hypothetical protein
MKPTRKRRVKTTGRHRTDWSTEDVREWLEGESQLRPEMDKADEKLERNCPEGLGPTTER